MEGNLLERKSIAGCRRENPYVLRLKYVLEKNPENLSERSAVGKSIAGKEKTGRFYYNQKINCMRAEGFAEYGCFMFFGEGAQPVLNVKNTLIHMKKCNIIH